MVPDELQFFQGHKTPTELFKPRKSSTALQQNHSARFRQPQAQAKCSHCSLSYLHRQIDLLAAIFIDL
jgi:hypothetical protein